MKYNEFVSSITKAPSEVLHSLDTQKCNLLHIAMGLSGESGEYLDTVKKHAIYNKPLDYENLNEEIGDLMFFIQAHCNHFEIDLSDIIQQNREKLEARYHEGSYSDKQAQERADKNEASQP